MSARLDACRGSSRLYFSHFVTHTVDNIINIVELYAAKPDTRPESCILPTPPSFDAPVVEFYLYPTVGTVLIHSIKPELTE